jgi:acetylornithine deacetylase
MAATTAEVTGRPCVISGSDGGCDAYVRHVYGHSPTVVFGATGGNAHAADEWVDIDSLLQATRVMALIIVRWCGTV